MIELRKQSLILPRRRDAGESFVASLMSTWAGICHVSCCLVISLLAPSNTAFANDSPLLFNLNVGEVGIGDNIDEPVRYGVDLRFRPITAWDLAPAVGAAWAENGARFVYVDIRRDFWLADRWALTPSFGVGTFDNGADLKLGNDLQFRSGIEIAFVTQSLYRLGLSVFHLSNGGLSERNPGTEALVLAFHIPFGHQ